jgi:hypothetical protein
MGKAGLYAVFFVVVATLAWVCVLVCLPWREGAGRYFIALGWKQCLWEWRGAG